MVNKLIDSHYLIRKGWHFVRLKTTNEKRWCHGGTFNSFTYQEARKIQADRDEKKNVGIGGGPLPFWRNK